MDLQINLALMDVRLIIQVVQANVKPVILTIAATELLLACRVTLVVHHIIQIVLQSARLGPATLGIIKLETAAGSFLTIPVRQDTQSQMVVDVLTALRLQELRREVYVQNVVQRLKTRMAPSV